MYSMAEEATLQGISSDPYIPTPPSSMVQSSVGTYLDPPSVLEILDPVLGESGSIKNSQEVPNVVHFMKDSNLMVQRCIVLNVIKSTESPTTLAKFMNNGGWGILNVWLAEAKKSVNISLLVEILQVLQKLPVSVEALKQGNMGKLIKQLTKQEHEEVQSLSADILTKWMTVFREGQSVKSKVSEERRTSTDDETNSTTKTKKDKKSLGKKKKENGKMGAPESMQPPPGPLVALGRPKDKTLKRPRELLVGQPPAEKKVKSSPSQEAKAGKVLKESEGFMNALSTMAAKMKEKKVKKVPKTSKLSRGNSTGDAVLTDAKLDQSMGNEGDGSVDDMEQQDDSTESGDPLKKKKKVSWASEDNLTMIRYFELDESERVNVNHPTSFLDAAQQEKMREREAHASGLMFSRDRLIEMMPWQRPPLLEVLGELVERGMESKERNFQTEREGKVLAQLFLSKSSVQPSPMEPDPETVLVETEPKLIPLMEPNVGGNQNQPPPFASPPHAPPGGPIHPGSPLPSPATTIHQAQSLINYFNEHGHSNGPPQMNHGGGGPNGGTALPPPPPPYPDSDNYYPPPQGYHHGDGPPPPPPGHWGPPDGGGGYYGEGYFRGQSDGPIRRGRGFGPPRGRGRGFGPPWKRGLESKICKHFITHGCKLGSRCKFLHCTPEELANKMATDDHPRNLQGRGGGSGRQYEHSPNPNGDGFSPSNIETPNADSPQKYSAAPPKEEHRSKVNSRELDDKEVNDYTDS